MALQQRMRIIIMLRKILKIIIILPLPLLLTHCLGSAAFTGGNLFYSRHELSGKVNNYKIVNQANQLLKRNRGLLTGSRVDVASFRYELLLVGQVKSAQVRKQVVAMMRDITGVKIIYNYLTISEPLNTAAQNYDSWLTTKIISKMIANNDINPSDFKIVTEDSTVYIMGHVEQEQGDIMINIASNTTGVNNVVTLLRYIRLT